MLTRERTVEEIMLTEAGRFLELHRGQLRKKPTDMSENHNRLISRLHGQLFVQLDSALFEIRTNAGRVRRGDDTYYIPDLYVVPIVGENTVRGRPYQLEVFDRPLPLVVEAWSPSTGTYDVNEKLPEYQRRGDLEIWRIHPEELTLTVWRRQPDGRYVDAAYRAGPIELVALPGIVVDLDLLFA